MYYKLKDILKITKKKIINKYGYIKRTNIYC